MAATTTTATAATAEGGCGVIVSTLLAASTREGECRKSAAHLLAVALCAYHLIGMLVGDYKLEF